MLVECWWAQVWSLNPWVWITVLCDCKLVSVFGFLHLKNGIYSKTQLIYFLEGLNMLKCRKCWEQWLTHSKCLCKCLLFYSFRISFMCLLNVLGGFPCILTCILHSHSLCRQLVNKITVLLRKSNFCVSNWIHSRILQCQELFKKL